MFFLNDMSNITLFHSDDGRQSGIGDNYQPTSTHPNYAGMGGNQFLQSIRSQVRWTTN